MLTMYFKKYIFFVAFAGFASLSSKHENSLSLFLLRIALLKLDLSSEAATRGVLKKKLFLERLQHSQLLTVKIKLY